MTAIAVLWVRLQPRPPKNPTISNNRPAVFETRRAPLDLISRKQLAAVIAYREERNATRTCRPWRDGRQQGPAVTERRGHMDSRRCDGRASQEACSCESWAGQVLER